MKRPSSQKGNAISRQLRTGPSARGTGKGKNPVSTPCKAFGHTRRSLSNNGCFDCHNIWMSISNSNIYWFKRIILGLPAAEATAGGRDRHRDSVNKYRRRRRLADPTFRALDNARRLARQQSTRGRILHNLASMRHHDRAADEKDRILLEGVRRKLYGQA